MERNLLADLIKDGGEAQAILKKGLVFLKHRRFAEALEWWTLNRQSLDPSSSRLSLLLLVMETLTHLWSGQPDRAAARPQPGQEPPAVSQAPAGLTAKRKSSDWVLGHSGSICEHNQRRMIVST